MTTAPNAKCQQVLVLAVCLVRLVMFSVCISFHCVSTGVIHSVHSCVTNCSVFYSNWTALNHSCHVIQNLLCSPETICSCRKDV